MIVTGYEEQKKNKDRISIFLDGKYGFSLSADGFLKFKIHKGKELSAEDIEFIKSEDEGNAAFSRLLFIIQYGMKTEKEIHDKLVSKGFSQEASEFALKKGREYGYVNDIYYTDAYIKSRAIPAGWGEQKIISNLYKKGIPPDIVKERVNEIYTDDDRHGNALELALKKLRTFGDVEYVKKRQKLYSFLAGRGFSYDVIKKVVEEALKEGQS